MKIQISTLILLTALFLTGCTNNIETPAVNPTPTPEPVIELSRYTDPDYHIAFNHPSSWQIDKQRKNDINVRNPQNKSLYGTINIYENPKRLSLKKFEEAQAKIEISGLVRPLISDSHLKMTTTNGLEAYQIETFCEPIECEQYIVVMDDLILRISNFNKSTGHEAEMETRYFKELINSLEKN